MVVSLKHTKVSSIPDGPDTSLVLPSDWNAEHTLTQATGTLLGRTTAGTGATEEITPSSELTLSAGALGVATTLGAKVISANTSGAALRITQTGSGNALLVEDSANPDASPVAVTTDGTVLIGDTVERTIASVTTSRLQLSSESSLGYQAGLSAIAWDAEPGSSILAGPVIGLARSASDTTGTQAALVANNTIGSLWFSGSDGTTFVRAASIIAAVDGTPGTGDMPTRLLFSTTADGAAAPTERMRIDSAGNIGIGTTSAAGYRLLVGGSATGASSARGVASQQQVQSDATAYQAFRTSITTQAASFTIGSMSHLELNQGAFGAGSTVTNQFGVNASSTLIGAANNFGFYSNIAAGTSRTITTVARTSNVVTITTSVAHGYTAGQSVTVAATTNTSLNGTFTITSVPTTSTFTYAQTAADLPSTADTGSTVVVGRWNFYANGTAPNYFAGNVGVGTTGGDFGRDYRFVARRDQNANTEIGVINGTSGASATASVSKIGGTANSFVNWMLQDQSGTPVDTFDYGAGVTAARWSFGGTERMRIDSAGDVGIGTTNPTARLNVVDATSQDAVRITQTGTGNALVVEDSANPDSTPFVVDASGNVIVGKTTADASFGLFQTHGSSAFQFGSASYANNSSATIFQAAKSRGGVGSQVIVQNNDDLFSFRGLGSDGTGFIRAAQINISVDGVPGTNDMPGRITFSTTPDGASVPTEKMRIDNAGNVGIGGSSTTAGEKLRVVTDTGNIGMTLEAVGVGPYFRLLDTGSSEWSIGIPDGSGDLSVVVGRNSGASGTECVRVTSTGNLQFNSGYGSVVTAYGCRAWVNFDGTTNTAGNCTIRASGGVSTVADNGTGDYTVNFTTTLPDANYGFNATVGRGTTSNNYFAGQGTANPTTSALRIQVRTDGGSLQDAPFVCVSIFR